LWGGGGMGVETGWGGVKGARGGGGEGGGRGGGAGNLATRPPEDRRKKGSGTTENSICEHGESYVDAKSLNGRVASKTTETRGIPGTVAQCSEILEKAED